MFTPDEANALLPTLRKDLEQLQRLTREYEERYIDLQDRKSGQPGNAYVGAGEVDPFFAEECGLDFMRMEIRAAIRGFELKGVQLKMIDPGLIDFPAMLDGRTVLLCWKQGEPQVAHYHGLEDGFLGRKPLDRGE